MKKQNNVFRLSKITAAVSMATLALSGSLTFAGPGRVPATSYTVINGAAQCGPELKPGAVGYNAYYACINTGSGTVMSGPRPTYYANSPAGKRIDPVDGVSKIDTGTPLRKFIDTLPGLGSSAANNLGQYLPVGVADTVSYPGADYFEIAVVEYQEQLHSDLPKPTTLRGYVQIDRAMTNSSSVAGVAAASAYRDLLAALSTQQAAYTAAVDALNAFNTLVAGLDAANVTYAAQNAPYAPLAAGLAAAQTGYSTLLTQYNSDLATYSALVAALPTQQLAYNAAVSNANAAMGALQAANAGVQTNYDIVKSVDAQYQALVDGLPAAQSAYSAAMAPVTTYQQAVANLASVQAGYTAARQPLVDYNTLVAQLPKIQSVFAQAKAAQSAEYNNYAANCLKIMTLAGTFDMTLCTAPVATALIPPAGYGFASTSDLSNGIVSVVGAAPAAPAVPAGYTDIGSGVLEATLPAGGLVIPSVPGGYIVDAAGTLSVFGPKPGDAAIPTGFQPTGTGTSLAVTPVIVPAPAGYTVTNGVLTVTKAAPILPAVPAGYVDLGNGTLLPGVPAPVVPAGYALNNGALVVPGSQPAAPVVPPGYVLAVDGVTLTVPPLPSGSGFPSQGSLGIPLLYPNGQQILVPLENDDHSLKLDPNGNTILVPAFAYNKPHYLGPVIVATGQSTPTATDNRPVRVKFDNLLPTGRAQVTKDANGNVTSVVRNGDLFIPFDTTLIGAGATPVTGETYMQNRANLHLHGGNTPWISDGTPHQWTTPVGESASVTQRKGASLSNVPDMPEPGDGSQTLFWTNAQSARLMFYHDHTVGQTRLNVYAGMAAGYVVTEASEASFMQSTGLDLGIPLVVQEKTFVPLDIDKQDTKWRQDAWGAPGDLWYPHVVENNQDPNSRDTQFTNPVGRWDYALWFWPVYPVTNELPSGEYGNVTTTPEAYGDTAMVNGTIYPTMTVNPEPTRLRFLNAANDRMLNLQLYVADPSVTTDDGRKNTEVKMVSAVGTDANGNTLPDCQVVAGQAYDQLAVPLQAIDDAGNPIAGACYPYNWPTDGRTGGVPDPSMVGPTIWHIGSEAGLLPKVAAEPPVPINFDANRRSVTVLNVSQNNDPTQVCATANGGAGSCHGLYLGTAERADVVIDFSAYAGKTLIMYNDAPAPNPAYDPRIDYFTNDPDNTLNGGAPTTLAGYGPNTRTIMQIKVAPNPTAKTLKGGAAATAQWVDTVLNPALQAAYAASQDAPLVAQPAYDQAFKNSVSGGTAQLGTIFLGSNSQLNVNFLDGQGSSKKYCVPNVIPPVAGATTFPDNMSSLQLPQGCDGPILNKAIQELFDKYGRMNATLGMEIPATTQTTQTTIPLGYIDPVTESLPAGETQIWKITHNGVDAHPVHFHLLNVQVLNRVGWDGTLKEPEDGELGWKETIKMNPLEDVIVAVKAVRPPPLPGFGVPKSSRAMDPSKPLYDPKNPATINPPDFMNLDPYTNIAPTGGQQNVLYDYDWEYVWHCHILGHEENDFMRPFIFTGMSVAPTSASSAAIVNATFADSRPGAVGGAVAALPSGAPSNVALNGNTLTWTDSSTNEYKFDIQQAPFATPIQKTLSGTTYYVQGTQAGTFSSIGSALANAHTWTAKTALPTSATAFRVVAVAAGGSAPSALVTTPVVTPAPAAAAGLTTSNLTTTGVKLSWNNPTPSATSGVPVTTTADCFGAATCIGQTTAWSNATPITTAAYKAGAASYTYTNLTPGTNYTLAVTETNASGNASATVNVTTPMTALAANPIVSYTAGPVANVSWAAVSGAVSYNVQYSINGVTTTTTVSTNSFQTPANALTAGKSLVVSVAAVSASGVASAVKSVTSTVPAIPNVSGLSFANVTTASLTANWTATNSASGTGYSVQMATDSAFANVVWTTPTTTNSLPVSGLLANTAYWFRVAATDNNGASIGAYANGVSQLTLPGTATAPGFTSATATGVTVSLATMTGATGYQLYVNGTANGTVSLTNPRTVNGLTGNTTYNFTVANRNATGLGAQSSALTVLTPPATPGAPANTRGAANSHATTVTFTALPGVSYTLIQQNQTTNVTTTVASNLTIGSYTVTGLTVNQNYRYALVASNAPVSGVVGGGTTVQGAWSAAITAR